jgi:hypothetical protein
MPCHQGRSSAAAHAWPVPVAAQATQTGRVTPGNALPMTMADGSATPVHRDRTVGLPRCCGAPAAPRDDPASAAGSPEHAQHPTRGELPAGNPSEHPRGGQRRGSCPPHPARHFAQVTDARPSDGQRLESAAGGEPRRAVTAPCAGCRPSPAELRSILDTMRAHHAAAGMPLTLTSTKQAIDP